MLVRCKILLLSSLALAGPATVNGASFVHHLLSVLQTSSSFALPPTSGFLIFAFGNDSAVFSCLK